MNASQYTDKQIMDLVSQGSLAQSKDFIDLMKHPERYHRDSGGSANELDGIRSEKIAPSYDFQPIRPITATKTSCKSFSNDGVSAARVWSSEYSKTNSNAHVRNYSSLNSSEPAKAVPKQDRYTFDASSLVSEIDRAMKRHTDDVLHALEALSARVTQMESRAFNLESSIDDLKVSVGNSYGSTDGKMRQLENILREAQNGVHVLKDKQNILEGCFQLVKLQGPKPDQRQETQNPSHVESIQTPSITQQSLRQLPPPPIPQAPFPQPYQFPPGQQQTPIPSPAAPPPHQQYPPPPSPPQYSQPPELHPSGNHSEEPPYLPPHCQPYPPPQPPSQQLYGAPSHMYDQPPSRSSSDFSSNYGHNPMVSDHYSYSGPSSQYSSSRLVALR